MHVCLQRPIVKSSFLEPALLLLSVLLSLLRALRCRLADDLCIVDRSCSSLLSRCSKIWRCKSLFGARWISKCVKCVRAFIKGEDKKRRGKERLWEKVSHSSFYYIPPSSQHLACNVGKSSHSASQAAEPWPHSPSTSRPANQARHTRHKSRPRATARCAPHASAPHVSDTTSPAPPSHHDGPADSHIQPRDSAACPDVGVSSRYRDRASVSSPANFSTSSQPSPLVAERTTRDGGSIRGHGSRSGWLARCKSGMRRR